MIHEIPSCSKSFHFSSWWSDNVRGCTRRKRKIYHQKQHIRWSVWLNQYTVITRFQTNRIRNVNRCIPLFIQQAEELTLQDVQLVLHFGTWTAFVNNTLKNHQSVDHKVICTSCNVYNPRLFPFNSTCESIAAVLIQERNKSQANAGIKVYQFQKSTHRCFVRKCWHK